MSFIRYLKKIQAHESYVRRNRGRKKKVQPRLVASVDHLTAGNTKEKRGKILKADNNAIKVAMAK